MSGYRKVYADEGLGSVSGVVSSLPAGYTLGQLRQEGVNTYKLAYNAGNSQASVGYFLTPAKGGAGPYSLTVSSASKTFADIGAVYVHNATATTGTYFWGMVNGYSAKGLVGDASSIPTGSPFFIGANGTAELFPQSAVTGNNAVGFNVGAVGTVTTGALTGDPFINLL